MVALSGIDLAAVFLYLAVTLAFGLWAGRPAAGFHWWDLEPGSAVRGMPWYRDYRVQAAAFGVLLVALIAASW